MKFYRKGRNLNTYNMILSYLIAPFFGSGFRNRNYWEIIDLISKLHAPMIQNILNGNFQTFWSYYSDHFPKVEKLNISSIYKQIIIIFFCESFYSIYLQVSVKNEIRIQPPEPRKQHNKKIKKKIKRGINY